MFLHNHIWRCRYIFYSVDQCNRKSGFDSPKVIIIMDMHYAFLIMIISAVAGRDRDLQGWENLPESWGLEGEREAWLPRV